MSSDTEMRVRLTVGNQWANKAPTAAGYADLGSHEQRFPLWITRLGAVLANVGDATCDERNDRLRALRLESEARLRGGAE